MIDDEQHVVSLVTVQVREWRMRCWIMTLIGRWLDYDDTQSWSSSSLVQVLFEVGDHCEPGFLNVSVVWKLVATDLVYDPHFFSSRVRSLACTKPDQMVCHYNYRVTCKSSIMFHTDLECMICQSEEAMVSADERGLASKC